MTEPILVAWQAEGEPVVYRPREPALDELVPGLDPWQVKLLEERLRTGFRGCRGPGKTSLVEFERALLERVWKAQQLYLPEGVPKYRPTNTLVPPPLERLKVRFS